MSDRAGVVPQLLGAAVGIVLGSALLFALLGMLRGDDPTPEVADAPAGSEQPDEVLADDASAAPDTTDTATEDEASEEPATEATEDPSPEPEPVESPEPAASPEPVEEETQPPAGTVDPSEVSIQVLDAVGGEEGAAAAQEVADELRAAGYNVVVINRAGRPYDVTTVFWSQGQEDGGRAVAAELGTSAAEQTPEEVQLSDSVDVHVVVGADRT